MRDISEWKERASMRGGSSIWQSSIYSIQYTLLSVQWWVKRKSVWLWGGSSILAEQHMLMICNRVYWEHNNNKNCVYWKHNNNKNHVHLLKAKQQQKWKSKPSLIHRNWTSPRLRFYQIHLHIFGDSDWSMEELKLYVCVCICFWRGRIAVCILGLSWFCIL